MIKTVKILCFFWPVLCAIAFAQSADYLARIFPSGVAMGMDGAQLRETRKDAIRRAMSGGVDPEKNYDLIERSGTGTVNWYYIRNGALRGYMRTTRPVTIGLEQQQAERELIIPSNDSGFAKESEEQALRAGQDLEPVVISVTKWKHATSNLRLYTVSTNDEITVIIFDPSNLSREIFFASTNLKEDLNAQAAVIKKKLGITNRPSNNDAQGK